MSLRRSVMGFGLKALNRLAGLKALDKPETRARVASVLNAASRAGFGAALVMNRRIGST
jgi:hypothetical protein